MYQLQKAAHMNNGNQLVDLQEDAEEDIRNAKLQTLKELFPQRSDQDLLQVIILCFFFIYFDNYFVGSIPILWALQQRRALILISKSIYESSICFKGTTTLEVYFILLLLLFKCVYVRVKILKRKGKKSLQH